MSAVGNRLRSVQGVHKTSQDDLNEYCKELEVNEGKNKSTDNIVEFT